MQITAQQYNCNLCRKSVPFEKVRYFNDGKRLICLDCYDKLAKENKARVEQVKKEEAVAKKVDSMKVKCMHCSYKFNLKAIPRTGVRCPYCGGEDVMRDDTTADMLLKNLLGDRGA